MTCDSSKNTYFFCPYIKYSTIINTFILCLTLEQTIPCFYSEYPLGGSFTLIGNRLINITVRNNYIVTLLTRAEV